MKHDLIFNKKTLLIFIGLTMTHNAYAGIKFDSFITFGVKGGYIKTDVVEQEEKQKVQNFGVYTAAHLDPEIGIELDYLYGKEKQSYSSHSVGLALVSHITMADLLEGMQLDQHFFIQGKGGFAWNTTNTYKIADNSQHSDYDLSFLYGVGLGYHWKYSGTEISIERRQKDNNAITFGIYRHID